MANFPLPFKLATFPDYVCYFSRLGTISFQGKAWNELIRYYTLLGTCLSIILCWDYALLGKFWAHTVPAWWETCSRWVSFNVVFHVSVGYNCWLDALIEYLDLKAWWQGWLKDMTQLSKLVLARTKFTLIAILNIVVEEL